RIFLCYICFCGCIVIFKHAQEMPQMPSPAPTIEERMRQALAELTRAERQAASHILSHFPMSALGSITALARAAEVSSPTIVRLVQKLGFRGYTDYQNALREEVESLLTAPLGLPE